MGPVQTTLRAGFVTNSWNPASRFDTETRRTRHVPTRGLVVAGPHMSHESSSRVRSSRFNHTLGVLFGWGLLGCGADIAAVDELDVAGEALELEALACEPPNPRRQLSVEFMGRYSTGLVGFESSGETAALKDDRLFVTSAEAIALDVVDVSNPAAPTLVERVDLSAYGASVQSVDVSSRGLVAVAVGGFLKTDPGTIVFLDKHRRRLAHGHGGRAPRHGGVYPKREETRGCQ
jgi:hypothetical protein